ncbi:MAG: ROK family protein [Pirellulales bacterium]
MPKVLKKPQAVADLESALVRFVQAGGGVSRVEVARHLKLVPSTAGIYVDRLLAARILTETPAVARGQGRPPLELRLNPKAGSFIGVDFDARQILATAVDFAQRPLAETRRNIPARAGVARCWKSSPRRSTNLPARRRDLLGIGLGVPGPVDPERGVSRYYSHLPHWRDVPIGPYVAERFGVPTAVENNVRSMALAELAYGHGRGLRHLVCLGIRTGIGSGLIADGRLLPGATNTAGEIGRWIDRSVLARDDTARQTIEDTSSLGAILAAAELAGVAELLEALASGRRRVVELVREAAGVHAWAAWQLAAALDPEAVIVAGPLAEQHVYQQALAAAARRCGGDDFAALLITSTLGPFAGALGAAALAFQHWKPRR